MKKAAEVVPADIEAWKKQYGTIGKITATENGEKKTSYVRSPTNKEIDFASANLTKGALTQYGISLYKTCLVAGDEFTSEAALRTAGTYMNQMIEEVEVEFEKL